MSLTQYQEAMDKHLKAEEKPIRDKDWHELTEEDKLDLEVEKTVIDKELQRRHDLAELEVGSFLKTFFVKICRNFDENQWSENRHPRQK